MAVQVNRLLDIMDICTLKKRKYLIVAKKPHESTMHNICCSLDKVMIYCLVTRYKTHDLTSFSKSQHGTHSLTRFFKSLHHARFLYAHMKFHPSHSSATPLQRARERAKESISPLARYSYMTIPICNQKSQGFQNFLDLFQVKCSRMLSI